MNKEKRDYTYEEYLELPEHVGFWASRISKEDLRPFHPEDYVYLAYRLINKAKGKSEKYNFIEENRLFAMVMLLFEHTECHNDSYYTFLNWFDYVIERNR